MSWVEPRPAAAIEWSGGPVRLLTPMLKKAFDNDVAENMRSAKAHVEQLARH